MRPTSSAAPRSPELRLSPNLPGIIYAGLAAMVSFLPLAFVNFKGLAELGLIRARGLLSCCWPPMLLAPSLVMALERCASTGKPHQCPGEPPPFLHLEWRHPVGLWPWG